MASYFYIDTSGQERSVLSKKNYFIWTRFNNWRAAGNFVRVEAIIYAHVISYQGK